MLKRSKSYESGLYERLRDPVYAKEYLRAALEDHDEGAEAVFLLALRDIAKANHMTYVAEATGLNRESLYKMGNSGFIVARQPPSRAACDNFGDARP